MDFSLKELKLLLFFLSVFVFIYIFIISENEHCDLLKGYIFQRIAFRSDSEKRKKKIANI